MRVFLTGATGLVGLHLVRLLRDRGHGVVALQRSTSNTARLRALGVEIVQGDVRDAPERIAEIVGECDAAVHAAALIYADLPWPKVRAVNVEGTARVLEGAAMAGARAAVHVSSIAVYGSAEEGPIDESSPIDTPLRPGDLYARSKREAEEEASRVAAKTGLRVSVVRPAVVYGEGDRLFSPKVGRLARLPVVPLLGDGTNTLPVVYAGNVAAGIAAALDEGEGERAYDLALDEPLTQRALVDGIARGMGIEPRLLPFPPELVRAAARFGDAVGLTLSGAGEVSLRRIARLGLRDSPYVSRRAREELGWDPPFSHAGALRRTGAWLDG